MGDLRLAPLAEVRPHIRHVLAGPVLTPAMVSDAVIASIVFVSVSLCLPCFLYGAY